MPVKRCRALSLVAMLALVTAGCSGGSSPAASTPQSPTFTPANPSTTVVPATPSSAGTPGAIVATESEWKIQLSNDTVSSGENTFRINNAGTQEHEFVVIRTDVAADKLPVENGEVTLDASGLSAIGKKQGIAAGQTVDLPLTLTTGTYVLICNIPGHYQQGMHVELTVR